MLKNEIRKRRNREVWVCATDKEKINAGRKRER